MATKMASGVEGRLAAPCSGRLWCDNKMCCNAKTVCLGRNSAFSGCPSLTRAAINSKRVAPAAKCPIKLPSAVYSKPFSQDNSVVLSRSWMNSQNRTTSRDNWGYRGSIRSANFNNVEVCSSNPPIQAWCRAVAAGAVRKFDINAASER